MLPQVTESTTESTGSVSGNSANAIGIVPATEAAPAADPMERGRPVVLMTGASGLIGGRLAERLTGEYRVVGLDLKPPSDAARSHMAAFFEADLTEDDSVGWALGEVRDQFGDTIASVVHLAAYYDFSGEPSPLYETLTVGGTDRLLRAVRAFETEQFLFSSSLLVMEPNPHAPFTELSPTRAEWEYPKSKLRAEAVIREHHGEVPYVLARLAGVYDEDCNSVPIGQQMARIYEKQLESYVFPGNPDHGNAFIHLDDLAEVVKRIIDRRRHLDVEEVFLISEPEVVSYADLQDLIGEALHGREWPTIRIPKFVAKAGAWAMEKMSFGDEDDRPFIKPWMIDLADDHYEADITHARRILDWEPRHRLRREIPVMCRRLQENPQRWYRANKLPLPESVKG
jgi:nucleoside-diphosphate-sugar epimerase